MLKKNTIISLLSVINIEAITSYEKLAFLHVKRHPFENITASIFLFYSSYVFRCLHVKLLFQKIFV
jgi:hypothetical protein